VGLPRLILLSFSRGLAKFEVAPGGLKGGNVDAAVVAIAGAIFFVFWGFGVGAFGLGGRALGLFHVADGFGLLNGGGFGEGAGFKAGGEVFVDAVAAAHGLVLALGVEEFGDEFKVHGVVAAQVLQNGPGIGAKVGGVGYVHKCAGSAGIKTGRGQAPAHSADLALRQVFDEGFHGFAGAGFDGLVGVLDVDEVGPLEDFSKAKLVQGMDNRVDGGAGTDDQDLDGFAIGLGVGVELEGKLHAHGFGQATRSG
jgi:hypothetical protein